MKAEHPASDHEMLCEMWEMTRKMMAALDEVCYRTAIRSQEEQEGHDQKVRAALQNLLNACLAADANEELSEFVDGSLLDAARAALASGAVGKK